MAYGWLEVQLGVKLRAGLVVKLGVKLRAGLIVHFISTDDE